ncbi:hypothetical protein DFH08DRAFT_930819 [Mycena albidolilacea]|uniref:Uncharacterized protein n=1 Tax=Mycena albidolilacea TaxID=1033008 RepID=A0AAD7ALU9_9AGAR|nr:hypothetical protein DFH08DRAFT_930819 [Mycena albidolilacea]
MVTALTVEQVQLHSDNLTSTANFRVFPLLVETALYAIFTVLIVASTYLLLTRGRRSRANKMMLCVTLVMYCLASWEWAVDVHRLRDDLKVLLPADLVQPPPDHARRVKVNIALHIAQGITNNICVVLSDMVVCWRVYVVFGRNKRVLVMAVFLLIVLACAIFLCNLTQIGQGFPSVTTLHRLVPSQLIIDAVALALSALINVWATTMIGYQAWHCRRAIRHYLSDTSNRTYAGGMMALFVESGIVYSILWILRNIIIIPGVEPSAYTIYSTMVMYQVTGMYPTLIVILVALRKSHLEHQFTSYGDVQTCANPTGARTPAFSSSAWSPARFTSVSPEAKIITMDQNSSTEFGSKESEKSEI